MRLAGPSVGEGPLARVSWLLGWVLRLPIHLYRWVLSPLLPRSCRFHPSCSVYALEALRVHGPLSGLYLTFRRLSRCHPFHPGGVDPVPPRPAQSSRSSRRLELSNRTLPRRQ